MSSQQANFIISLFSEFEKRNIRWAILRNSEEVPNDIGNDVDMLLDSHSVKAASRCILEFAHRNNIGVVGVIEKYRYTCVLLQLNGDDERALPIDLIGGCFTRGMENVDSRYGLENRVLQNNIWVVPRGFEAAATLMKELLPHGVIAERCRSAILDGAKTEPETFKNSLAAILAPGTISTLLDACNNDDWETVAKNSTRVRNEINKSYLKRMQHIPGFIYATIKHYSRPSFSCFVVIIGPDGSGKTTIADELVSSLKKNPFKITKHVPTNFGVLPQLKEFKKYYQKLLGGEVQVQDNPVPGEYLSGMDNPVHSPLKGSLYVLWYGIDMFLGRLLLRRWRGQGGLIVFARYYYDYYFQAAHQNTPKWVKDIVGLLVPKPDIVFSIQRSAEDIFNGKPELTVEEILRQQEAIRAIMSRLDNAHILEGGEGVVDTTKQARAIINSNLKNKFKNK